MRLLFERRPNILETQANVLRRTAEPLVEISVEHLDAPQHLKHGRQEAQTQRRHQNLRTDLRAFDASPARDVELDGVPEQDEAEQDREQERQGREAPVNVSLLRTRGAVFSGAERTLIENHSQQYAQQPDASAEFDFVAHLGRNVLL